MRLSLARERERGLARAKVMEGIRERRFIGHDDPTPQTRNDGRMVS